MILKLFGGTTKFMKIEWIASGYALAMTTFRDVGFRRPQHNVPSLRLRGTKQEAIQNIMEILSHSQDI
jgi:hypothetical protein